MAKLIEFNPDIPGPLLTDCGREPSLRSILISYYFHHGIDNAKAKILAQDYIDHYGE